MNNCTPSMTETLQNLDHIRLNFSQSGLHLLNISLAIIMFGVALELKTEHFKELIKHPRPAIVGIISQLVLLPAVTLLAVILLHKVLTPTIALGMILVAACPGGNISNYINSLAKSNVELAISLTAISTVLAVFSTPFNFSFYGGIYNHYLAGHDASHLLRPLEIDGWQMFRTVIVILGIPMIVGISIANRFPSFTAKIIKPAKRISLILFVFIIIGAISGNISYFVQYAPTVFLIVLAHNALAFLSGYLFAKTMKVGQINSRTICIETGIHNTGLGLVLLFNEKIFPPDLEIGGMAFIAAGWGIWHIIGGSILAFIWKKKPVN